MSRLCVLLLGVAVSCAAPRPGTAPAAGAVRGEWLAPGGFFAISVSDAPAVSAWYRDVLGFELLRQGRSADGTLRFALLRRAGHLVEIIERKDAAAPAAMPDRSYERGIFKVGFWVANLDAFAAELRGTRTRFVHDIVAPPGADYRTFAVVDPENNVVQFFGR